MTSQEDKDFSLKDYLLYVPLHDLSLGDMKKCLFISRQGTDNRQKI